MSTPTFHRAFPPTYWDELKGAPLTSTILGVLMMGWTDVYRHIPGVPIPMYLAVYAAAILFWPTIAFAFWVYWRHRYGWPARLALAAGLVLVVWVPILATIVYWCIQP